MHLTNFKIVLLALTFPLVFDSALAECDSVGDPYQFEFVVVTDLAIATWYKPTSVDADCELEYELLYYVNDDLTETLRVTSEFHIFDHVRLCSTAKLSLTAVDVSGIRSTTLDESADAEIATITDLEIVDGVATWVVPDYAEHCKYEVKLNDDILEAATSENTYTLEDLSVCIEYDFVVTPKHFNSNPGSPLGVNFEIGAEVSDFIQTGSILSWEVPSVSNPSTCSIRLEFDDHDPINVKGTSFDVSATDLYPCVLHNVIVRSTGEGGGSTEGEFEMVPGYLDDFSVDQNDDGEIIATWSEKFQKCSILIEVDTEEHSYSGTSAELVDFTFDYCAYYAIFAQAVDSKGNEGEEAFTNFKRVIDPVPTFTVEQTADGLEATWDANYQQCTFTIRIEDEVYPDLPGSSALLPAVDVKYCVKYVAFLTIQDIDFEGEPTEADFSMTEGEIEELEIFEEDGEIKITWSEDFEECQPDVILDDESILESQIDKTTVVVNKEKFVYCAENMVKLILSAADTDFSMDREEPFILPGDVDNIKFSTEGGYVVASWSDELQSCSIEIEIDGFSETYPSSPAVMDAFSLNPCTTYSASVTTIIANGGRGPPLTTTVIKEAKIEDSAFEITQNNGFFVPSWSDGFDTCIFDIIFLPAYKYYESHISGVPLDESSLSYCSKADFGVIVRIMSDDHEVAIDEVMYRPIDIELQEDFDAIESLEIKLDGNSVTASWNVLDTMECDLSYDTECDTSDSPNKDTVTDTEYTFACTVESSTTLYTISLQPKYNDVDGAVVLCNYEVVTEDDVVSLRLSATSNSAVCPAESTSADI